MAHCNPVIEDGVYVAAVCGSFVVSWLPNLQFQLILIFMVGG